MIDKTNEIFTLIASEIKKKFKDIEIIPEYIDLPSKFPTITISETQNIASHLDTKPVSDYADITYRVQVFTTGVGKQNQARKILVEVDKLLQTYNFKHLSMNDTPSIYNAKVYQINNTYEATIDKNGVIYRK